MRAGPSSHARYFQLKGFDKQKRAEFIQRRRGAYTAFGTVAMALNLVPVASMFFQRESSRTSFQDCLLCGVSDDQFRV